MSLKPELNIKSVIGPRTKVIVWVSEENFSTENDIYSDLNYIFDGMLARNINQIKADSPALFTTKSFGSNLYLFRIHPNKVSEIKSEIFKKAESGIKSHALLLVDSKLEPSYYKISKEFDSLNNLEMHLTKDLIKGH